VPNLILWRVQDSGIFRWGVIIEHADVQGTMRTKKRKDGVQDYVSATNMNSRTLVQ
jgi:hypothetical protein